MSKFKIIEQVYNLRSKNVVFGSILFFKIGIQGSHCNAITVLSNMLDVENGNIMLMNKHLLWETVSLKEVKPRRTMQRQSQIFLDRWNTCQRNFFFPISGVKRYKVKFVQYQ